MAARGQTIGRIRRFNRFYTAFLGVLDRHFLESPFSLTEVRILYEIRHGAESLARDIGASLGIDRGYLSRIIDSFIARGLLHASPSPQDRRRRLITLTRKGKRMFDQLEARSEESVARAIQALSPREQEELVRHMERIQELLDRRA
jgi:DNA-binding MarR family transcriptional regulator